MKLSPMRTHWVIFKAELAEGPGNLKTVNRNTLPRKMKTETGGAKSLSDHESMGYS